MVTKQAIKKLASADIRAIPRPTGLVAALAAQPQLLVAALGTIGAGVATRRGDLVRGGARMLAAQLVATAMRDALGARIERSTGQDIDGDGRSVATRPAGSHHLTDVVVGGMVGWVAEAVVGAMFDRVEPVVERAIRSRLQA